MLPSEAWYAAVQRLVASKDHVGVDGTCRYPVPDTVARGDRVYTRA